LYSGFSRYYKGNGGFPKYKRKGKSKDSFYVSNDKAKLIDNVIKLPKVGLVPLAENFRYTHSSTKIMSYTVSREANKWYVSISVEINKDVISKPCKDGIIGIDVGLKTFITDSNNQTHKSPKPLKKHQKKLKKVQRALSRKKRNSKNRVKARVKVARVHTRIKNIRSHFLHNLTTMICKKNKLIVIEDLNIKGMLKNHKLAFHISDAAWGEFKRQLEYKSQRSGSKLIKADRFFPSSKTCSHCGYVKDKLELSEREFICEECGCTEDRDFNASTNLLAWGIITLIPQAIGKFTPVEIVALAQKPVSEPNTINEALDQILFQ
jgi:putative transposase